MSVLFYNGAEGKGEFDWIPDGKGTLQLLGSYTDWRKTWTHMVYWSVPSFLFSDAASGAAEFYGAGMQLLSSTTFSKGWTHIVCLGQDLSQAAKHIFPSEVLFYNSSNGLTQVYSTDGRSLTQQVFNSTFSIGWTQVVA